MKLIQKKCNSEDQRLLELLKKDILSRTTLARPGPCIRFYIKIDSSKDGMGSALLKSDDSEKARNLEARKKRWKVWI